MAYAGAQQPLMLPSDAVADYQLGGSYTPPAKVNVVVRDSTEQPAKGLYNICYVNGFQTQPGVKWPDDLLIAGPGGKPRVDPGWPDEFLLNISSDTLRKRILDRVIPMISRCAQAGYHAIEFDNLDSYTRSKGALTQENAIDFARILVRTAHGYGLAAGQKNAPDLSEVGKKQIGFNFVISEECHRFQECAAYMRIYGNQVINVEYVGNLRGSFASICSDPQTPRNTVLRDRGLSTRGNQHYAYKHC